MTPERRRDAEVERLNGVAVADPGAPVLDLENRHEFELARYMSGESSFTGPGPPRENASAARW